MLRDPLDHLLGVPNVLQHHGGAELYGQAHAVEKAGLMRDGRGDMNHVVAFQLQRGRQRQLRRDDGVAGVHHAFGLARGAGGEHDFCHVVGIGNNGARCIHRCMLSCHEGIPRNFRSQ